MKANEDEAIKQTNVDATSSKAAAVRLGYWKDPYIPYFYKMNDKKAPEINRGYFARVEGIKVLLNQFLQITNCNCQVVNFGAGSDTLFFNLRDANTLPLKTVDVDFKDIVAQKCHTIRRSKALLEGICDETINFENGELHSTKYHVIHADLRKTDEVSSKLKSCILDMSLPTIFLAECVLIYMTPSSSCALIKWIAETFDSPFFISYEQANMADRFGEVMIENLRLRGCSLAGWEHCKTLQTQKDRFLTNGWTGCEAINMSDVYHHIPKAEIARIERLEFLDEVEMLNQLLDHYCICWAYKDNGATGLDKISFKYS